MKTIFKIIHKAYNFIIWAFKEKVHMDDDCGGWGIPD